MVGARHSSTTEDGVRAPERPGAHSEMIVQLCRHPECSSITFTPSVGKGQLRHTAVNVSVASHALAQGVTSGDLQAFVPEGVASDVQQEGPVAVEGDEGSQMLLLEQIVCHVHRTDRYASKRGTAWALWKSLERVYTPGTKQQGGSERLAVGLSVPDMLHDIRMARDIFEQLDQARREAVVAHVHARQIGKGQLAEFS